MSAFAQFAISYTIAGFIVGGFVAAIDDVQFSFLSKKLPHPRIFAGLLAGLIWPLVLIKMVSGRLRETSGHCFAWVWITPNPIAPKTSKPTKSVPATRGRDQ
jgi:hypothetical protein